jgi:hypothetical protein
MDIPSTACVDIDDVEALERAVIICDARDRMALGTVNGSKRTLYAFSSRILAEYFIKTFLANRDAKYQAVEEPREDVCAKARAIAFTEIYWDLTVTEPL